jgi:type I restriction enzyme R subunit
MGLAMNQSPQFTTSEAGGAQLQALNTLINCGWRYVTRAEADQWRDGRRTLPFLETQLRADLARINRIHLDERVYPFSEANIDAAVRRLAERIPEGVVRANERMTDDLMLGIALPQTIGATSREWPLKFIDWTDWRANTFQVTSEYTISEAGGPAIRVDLVLFVNGIPLGVIEVKASHVSSDQGVGQQIRNQKAGEGVPALFYSTQLLLAANSHDPRYGTVGTPRKLWSLWKEREDAPDFAVNVVNRPLDTIEGKRVALDFASHMKRHNGLMEDHRFVTPLDETIVGLCRPERFMRLLRRYMLFDGPHKKVARYQQVATVETLLKQTEQPDHGDAGQSDRNRQSAGPDRDRNRPDRPGRSDFEDLPVYRPGTEAGGYRREFAGPYRREDVSGDDSHSQIPGGIEQAARHRHVVRYLRAGRRESSQPVRQSRQPACPNA